MALTERFEQALVYAASLHRRQTRKGTTIPYVAHLLGVASLVLEHGGDENEAIAALLHDAAEDQGGAKTLETIRQRFGDEVAAIVEGCTDTFTTPKPPWRKRKEAYIEHLKTASPSVRLVANCDKLHNARAILNDYRVLGDALWKRFTGGREGTLWYYRTLARTFRALGDTPVAIELSRVVGDLEEVASVAKRRLASET